MIGSPGKIIVNNQGEKRMRPQCLSSELLLLLCLTFETWLFDFCLKNSKPGKWDANHV